MKTITPVNPLSGVGVNSQFKPIGDLQIMATKSSATNSKTASASSHDPVLDTPVAPATGNGGQRMLNNATPFDALFVTMIGKTPSQDEINAMADFVEGKVPLRGMVPLSRSVSTIKRMYVKARREAQISIFDTVKLAGNYRQAAGIADEFGKAGQTMLAFVSRIETELRKSYLEDRGEDLPFYLPRWSTDEGGYVLGEVHLTDEQIQHASVWLSRTFGQKGNGQINKAYEWLKEQREQQG
jgi:hypothetical protein